MISSQVGHRRKVTIHTVAEAAQVSRQTVTNALLHPERVRPATLARVRAEISRLGYRPSAAAQSLQSQRAGAIGIELNALGPDYHNALMAPFLAALSVRARAHDIHMVTFGSDGSTPMIESYERIWASHLVDAFVIADTHHGDPRPGWLQQHRIPFASFGRVWDDPGFGAWVDVDGHHGTALAVEHCRQAGYRRIGYLGWTAGDSAVGDHRRAGWEDACRASGADTLGPYAESADDLHEATGAAAGLLARLSAGDAVVCASDVLAVGVLHAVHAAGLRPGADIGIVGFDDSELARMHRLSSVAQPIEEICRQTMRLLEKLLARRPVPAGEGTLLHPTLTPRASTDRPGSRPSRPAPAARTKPTSPQQDPRREQEGEAP